MEAGKGDSRGQLVISAEFLKALRKATFLCGITEQHCVVSFHHWWSLFTYRKVQAISRHAVDLADAVAICWPCSWEHVWVKALFLPPGSPQQVWAFIGRKLHFLQKPVLCLIFLSFSKISFIIFSLMCNYGQKSDTAQPAPGPGDDRLFMVIYSSHRSIR